MSARISVDSFINFATTSSLPARPALQDPPVPPRGLYRGFMQGMAADSATVDARKAFQMQNNRTRRENLIAMQQWWLGRMIASPAPLQEKMTLFWHGHFTSSPEKQTTAQELLMQNQLFREYALGNVRELTLHVSQDPAMLRYLDNNVNVKAHPNENYARELMELFTLGIGNYTEHDVPESAAATSTMTARRRFSAAAATSAAPTSCGSSSSSRPRRGSSHGSCSRSSSTATPSRSSSIGSRRCSAAAVSNCVRSWRRCCAVTCSSASAHIARWSR